MNPEKNRALEKPYSSASKVLLPATKDQMSSIDRLRQQFVGELKAMESLSKVRNLYHPIYI